MSVVDIVEKYCDLPGFLRRPLWRWWHGFIIKNDTDTQLTLMNYGYGAVNGEHPAPVLLEQDEEERFSIQLYDYVVSHTPIGGRHVLEVGCGRGGGASYITRYLKPESYIGLDLSDKGIAFCNQYHRVPGLSFIKGDAMAIGFEDNRFDAVVNVESSRCYPDVPRFFAEVRRVLKPEGLFYFADMRWKDDMPLLRQQIEDAGFLVEKAVEITQNVVKALDIDSERRDKLMARQVPKLFLSNFRQFAGVKGTERYRSFAEGKMEYWSFLLKPRAAG